MAFVGKTLIVVQNLPVPFDRRVWLEAKALHEAGCHVTVISPKDQLGKYPESYLCLDGIHIYRYPAPPEAHGTISYIYEFLYCWLWTAWLSLKVWRRHGFDVLHACNPPETYFLLAWFYKLFGKKFIFDHHDLSPEMYLAKGNTKAGALYRALLLLEKLTFKTADVIITTNESHKNIAMTRGGASEERIFIVRTGPDFERLRRLPPEPELKGGYPYLVCYLGEMCAQDGVDLMLEAAKMIRDDFGRQDVRFVLMGGGPELERLRQLNEKMGLTDFVTFTGRVSDHDLCRYLSTADVCLDPDPFSEWANQSTMNKIMEYMAFAKPTVAFDLRENRFSAQEAAVYAPPGNLKQYVSLLCDLLAKPDKRRQMGQFGLQRVQNSLAWDYSKPALLSAYLNASKR